MKKKKTILIILGAIVVAVIVYFNMTGDNTKTTTVSAAEVKGRDVDEEVSASGRIQPKTKVDISSEVNGEIIHLLVKDGQPVKSGDLLVVLDTVQLRSDVDQARFFVEEVSARLEGSRAILEQAEEEYDRQKSLHERNLTSETQYKNAKYSYINAKSTFEATSASAAQAQSRYEKQLDYLSKAKIVAPMSGTITFLDAEVGEIAAAQTVYSQGKTLMTISDLNVFEVEVEVDETEINKLALGNEVEIEVDAFPDTTFRGEVVEIGNTAITQGFGSDDQSTNFNVKVVFKDTDIKIRPGMSATVDITTANREDVLTVPFSAVVMRAFDLDSLEAARLAREAGEEESSGSVHSVQAAENDDEIKEDTATSDEDVEREELKGVFIIRDGKAFFVEVETGIADQKNIEIVSGLSDGDSVISGPYRVLREVKDGDAVKMEEKNGKGEQ